MTERWPVQHRCGHRVEWDLSRKHPDDRIGYAHWLAGRDCTRCWWANRRDPHQQARAARNRLRQVLQLQIWERQHEMPPLTGRPKAVAWARRVRHRLVTRAAQTAADAQGHCDDIHAAATRITTGAWWIDHRRLDPAALAAALEHSSRQPLLRRRGSGRIR